MSCSGCGGYVKALSDPAAARVALGRELLQRGIALEHLVGEVGHLLRVHLRHALLPSQRDALGHGVVRLQTDRPIRIVYGGVTRLRRPSLRR